MLDNNDHVWSCWITLITQWSHIDHTLMQTITNQCLQLAVVHSWHMTVYVRFKLRSISKFISQNPFYMLNVDGGQQVVESTSVTGLCHTHTHTHKHTHTYTHTPITAPDATSSIMTNSFLQVSSKFFPLWNQWNEHLQYIHRNTNIPQVALCLMIHNGITDTKGGAMRIFDTLLLLQ